MTKKTELAMPANPARRMFMGTTGQVALSATAIALLMGSEGLVRGAHAATASQDVSILNVALGLEHEAIAAYQLGAESGLLKKPVLDVAVQFQGHHKEHRDTLADTIRKLGGSPVSSKGMGQYASALKANTLGNQTDVLKLAARLEKGAANAYLGVIPAFKDSALAQVAGRLATDETMHWTVLAQVLGQPLPRNALSFGA